MNDILSCRQAINQGVDEGGDVKQLKYQYE